MLKNLIFFLLISGLGSLSAQSFIFKINPSPSQSPLKQPDTINVLAVMADFQEDRDAATFGNGKFGSIYSTDYGSSIIDPLPHDRLYFENHMQFIRNYFSKVSNNVLNINFNVLPSVVTVSKTMRNYSPPPNSTELSPVAEFAKEVWSKADSMNPGFAFSDYDLFLVFHAGVGRDISLPGSLGNERDLPSVYLGPEALTKIYPGFSGFPVNGGAYSIMNTGIIPETESRELSSFGSTFLFEVSINGLLAATVASYLGLPDLFDTETGLSAIGRFGLMDGQSIFAYNGLFPPEPSAWEKMYLGWVTPQEAQFNIPEYTLRSSRLAGFIYPEILKVNINSTEYFLLENRQRDVEENGAVVTYVSNGEVKTKTFPKDTTGFYSYAIDSLEGVIIDVDEFDWALPGNGIVIWHIDENIINQKLADNKINADINNRGVDVEEADGIQDIGIQFQTIFGDVVVGEGEQRDMWFESNDANLYENRFSLKTRPDTRSNTGANSLISIYGFSEKAPIMKFYAAFGDSIIAPVLSSQLQLPDGEISITHGNLFSVSVNNDVYLINDSGRTEITLPQFSMYKTAVYSSADSFVVAGVNRNLNVFINAGLSAPLNYTIAPGSALTTPPLILNNGKRVLAGSENGTIYSFDLITGNYDSVQTTASRIIQVAAHEEFYSFIAAKGNGFVYSDLNNMEVTLDYEPLSLGLTKNSAGRYVSVITGQGKRTVVSDGKIISRIDLESPVNSLALSDLKQDGNNYFITAAGSEIKVFNINGIPADNFPYRDPAGKEFDSYILAADFEGDASSEIIAVSLDGRITAIDGGTGKIVSGFPVSAGIKLKGSPVLYNSNNTLKLAAVDIENNFYIWNISSINGNLYWSENFGSSTNASFLSPAKNNNFVNEFFPQDKVYNYPNPVTDGRTFIRYYVSENSKINIKIFDLAGALVDELNTDASGGTDGEILWNAQNVQSGVYLARVEASGSGGRTETSIIKIAVVR